MLKHVNSELSLLEPITLADMGNVKLMNRTDTKFMFSANKLPQLLGLLKNYYSLVYIEGENAALYKNIYYDTPSFLLYFMHHNGRANRYKVRHRSYVKSGLGFLEVKLNKAGRTVKERMPVNTLPLTWCEQSRIFLSRHISVSPDALQQVLCINYSRITLVDKTFSERLTIDTDIEFANKEKTVKMENLTIAEVKQHNRIQSPSVAALLKMGIRPLSLSKYCLGAATVYSELQKNKFIQKLTLLNEIVHDDFTQPASGF